MTDTKPPAGGESKPCACTADRQCLLHYAELKAWQRQQARLLRRFGGRR